jgi:hypothetical protein
MYTAYIVRRTQIYLSEEQGRYLARRSKETGTTVSDLIRSAIDQTYLRRPALTTEEKIRIARATAGAWKDFPMTGEEYVERIRGRGRLARLHGLKR